MWYAASTEVVGGGGGALNLSHGLRCQLENLTRQASKEKEEEEEKGSCHYSSWLWPRAVRWSNAKAIIARDEVANEYVEHRKSSTVYTY